MTAKKRKELKDDVSKRPNLTSIILGGFQVFDKPTTIPFARLTFLFGPNSAGKSAVEDALILINEVLRGNSSAGSFDTGGSPGRFERLSQDWRRSSGDDNSFAPTLTLGTTFHVPTDLSALLATKQDKKRQPKHKALNHEVKLVFFYRVTFVDDGDGNGDHNPFVARDFTVSVDERELLQLQENQRFGLNLEHPVLTGSNLRNVLQKADQLSTRVAEIKDGWVWLKSKSTDIDASRKLDRIGFLNGILESMKVGGGEMASRTKPVLGAVADIFDLLHGRITSDANLHIDVVNASRKVPTSQQLSVLCATHLLEHRGLQNLSDKQRSLAHFGLAESRENGLYQTLAESFVTANVHEYDMYDPDLFNGVNRALTDHLFIERGYRLDADVKVIVDSARLRDLTNADSSEPTKFPLLVQLHLIDSQGRRFSFDQVGSGLGYVLPILSSMFHEIRISLLQQPELHLHPALQSELGDVMIEASTACKQLIVETHSEYLLLRVLKRIRQFSSNTAVSRELQLKPEEVSVVYFDPSPEGITKVKRLRISEDGDFLDQWPRGFFPERDKDLF